MENEVFGVIYERYAVGKKISRIAERLNVHSVAEMPAHGAKAMPSIYSMGFSENAEKITLINGNPLYEKEWAKIGKEKLLEWKFEENIENTSFQDGSFDMVWNFAYIPIANNPDQLIEEMKRISKRYVMIFSVNSGNVGFPIHRLVHKKTNIPWSHGNIDYNNRHFLKRKLQEHGLKIVATGFADCPIWPDSLGFRDVRLHRLNIDFNLMEWNSDYPEMLKNNKFPLWVRLVYLVEILPLPSFLKTLHSHINYTIAEKMD